jgi:hypothetical protein
MGEQGVYIYMNSNKYKALYLYILFIFLYYYNNSKLIYYNKINITKSIFIQTIEKKIKLNNKNVLYVKRYKTLFPTVLLVKIVEQVDTLECAALLKEIQYVRIVQVE